ncbi:MAG: DUF2306 domain-containing protein [Acidimicrobiales bacterium]
MYDQAAETEDLATQPIFTGRSRGWQARSLWGLMLLLAVGMTLIAALYIPDDFAFAEQRTIYEDNTFAILGHIVGASVPMILGPFQFLPGQRRRFLGLHRWTGRLYLLGVAVGSVLGFSMAWLAFGGIISSLGFATLAVLWLSTGAMALKQARAGHIRSHRDWMIRNYALTFAAVTLRIWLGLSQLAGVEFINAYRSVAWLSWIPNLLTARPNH